MKTVTTKWMDVAGNPSLYPVFDALRSDGHNGTYTFPDQAPAADLHPCDGDRRRGLVGTRQPRLPRRGPELDSRISDETLIGTAGHLHPGGLNTQLRDTRHRGRHQHPLHLRRPLLRAGGRGLMGRRDEGDAT